MTPSNNPKTFQEKLDEIIVQAILPPSGEKAGVTELRTKQAILDLIASDVIGVPTEDDSNGRYNLKVEQRSILHDMGEKK